MRYFIQLIFVGLILLNVSSGYSEEMKKSIESERYKLYIVENLNTSSTINHLPMGIAGNKNNYLLIDSFSGKSWILINITTSFPTTDGSQKYSDGFAWEPIFFRTESDIWKNYGTNELSVAPK